MTKLKYMYEMKYSTQKNSYGPHIKRYFLLMENDDACLVVPVIGGWRCSTRRNYDQVFRLFSEVTKEAKTISEARRIVIAEGLSRRRNQESTRLEKEEVEWSHDVELIYKDDARIKPTIQEAYEIASEELQRKISYNQKRIAYFRETERKAEELLLDSLIMEKSNGNV